MCSCVAAYTYYTEALLFKSSDLFSSSLRLSCLCGYESGPTPGPASWRWTGVGAPRDTRDPWGSRRRWIPTLWQAVGRAVRPVVSGRRCGWTSAPSGPSALWEHTRQLAHEEESPGDGEGYGAGTAGETTARTRAVWHPSLPQRRGGVRRLCDPRRDGHPPRDHPHAL